MGPGQTQDRTGLAERVAHGSAGSRRETADRLRQGPPETHPAAQPRGLRQSGQGLHDALSVGAGLQPVERGESLPGADIARPAARRAVLQPAHAPLPDLQRDRGRRARHLEHGRMDPQIPALRPPPQAVGPAQLHRPVRRQPRTDGAIPEHRPRIGLVHRDRRGRLALRTPQQRTPRLLHRAFGGIRRGSGRAPARARAHQLARDPCLLLPVARAAQRQLGACARQTLVGQRPASPGLLAQGRIRRDRPRDGAQPVAGPALQARPQRQLHLGDSAATAPDRNRYHASDGHIDHADAGHPGAQRLRGRLRRTLRAAAHAAAQRPPERR